MDAPTYLELMAAATLAGFIYLLAKTLPAVARRIAYALAPRHRTPDGNSVIDCEREWHDWLPWDKPDVTYLYQDVLQRRTCASCGKVEERKVGTKTQRDHTVASRRHSSPTP